MPDTAGRHITKRESLPVGRGLILFHSRRIEPGVLLEPFGIGKPCFRIQSSLECLHFFIESGDLPLFSLLSKFFQKKIGILHPLNRFRVSGILRGGFVELVESLLRLTRVEKIQTFVIDLGRLYGFRLSRLEPLRALFSQSIHHLAGQHLLQIQDRIMGTLHTD